MGRYKITRDYAAVRDGRWFGPWSTGSEVDLEAPDAQWVNRDSPGALEPAGDEKASDEPVSDEKADEKTQPKAKSSRGRGGKAAAE